VALSINNSVKIGVNYLIAKYIRKNGYLTGQKAVEADRLKWAQKKASGKLPDAFLDHTINPSVLA
jgi:hypothetical protein